MKRGILLLFIISLNILTLIRTKSICETLIDLHIKKSKNLKELLLSHMTEVKNEEKCLENLIGKGFVNEAEFLMEELNKRNIKFRDQLKIATSAVSQKVKDIYNMFRFDESDYVNASPAFQWAQNLDNVFIQIKYAHRFDSPGCLEVKKENFEIKGNVLEFTAFCIQGDTPIKFSLTLDLFDNINKEASTLTTSSVGRNQITLKKENPVYWNSLLKPGAEAPSNMRMWLEMREKYLEEIQKYIDEKDEEEYKQVNDDINKRKKKEEKIDL